MFLVPFCPVLGHERLYVAHTGQVDGAVRLDLVDSVSDGASRWRVFHECMFLGTSVTIGRILGLNLFGQFLFCYLVGDSLCVRRGRSGDVVRRDDFELALMEATKLPVPLTTGASDELARHGIFVRRFMCRRHRYRVIGVDARTGRTLRVRMMAAAESEAKSAVRVRRRTARMTSRHLHAPTSAEFEVLLRLGVLQLAVAGFCNMCTNRCHIDMCITGGWGGPRRC